MLSKFIKSINKNILYLTEDCITCEYIDVDGIHPNDRGYEMISKNIKKEMEEYLCQ